MNFYGRYKKTDFNNKPENDKYNTFLDLSKLECLPASGLTTLEEETLSTCDDSGAVMSPADVTEDENTGMGSSVGKQKAKQKTLSDNKENSNCESSYDEKSHDGTMRKLSNSDEFADCKSHLDEDVSFTDIKSPSNLLCTREPNSDDDNNKYDVTDTLYDAIHNEHINNEKNYSSKVNDKTTHEVNCGVYSSTNEVNNSFSDIDGNLLDENCNIEVKRKIQQTNANTISTNAPAEGLNQMLQSFNIGTKIKGENKFEKQTPSVLNHRKDSLYKRRDRSHRRASDPTGILREESRLFFKAINRGPLTPGMY